MSCLLTPAPPARVAADGERTLRGGIDLAIFAAQGGEQKGSALQRFGVADGGDVTSICVPARVKAGMDQVTKTAATFLTVMPVEHLQAQTLQHVGQHLGGEDGLLLVSGAVQSDHQAIAHQRVFAHSLHRGDLADAYQARSGRRFGGRPRRQTTGLRKAFSCSTGNSQKLIIFNNARTTIFGWRTVSLMTPFPMTSSCRSKS